MWNHAKKSMEGSKLSDSVFLQWDARSSVLKRPKNPKTPKPQVNSYKLEKYE